VNRKNLQLGRRAAKDRKPRWGDRWPSAERLLRLGAEVPRQRLYLGLVAMVLAALLDGIGIGLTIPFLRLLLNEGSLSLPAHPALQGVNLWLAVQPKPTLIALFALLILAALALKSGFSYTAEVLTGLYREDTVALFRKRLYEKYLHAPIAFFDNQKLGTLSHTLAEVISINILLSWSFALMINLIILTAYLATMVLVSWQLTLLIVGLIGGVGLGLSRLLKRIKQVGKAEVVARSDMNVRVLDTLSGIRIVKSYATEQFELRRFEQLSNTVRDTAKSSFRKVGLIDPLTEFATMAMAMVVLVGSYALLISRGVLGTSELMAFMLALIKIVPVSKRINAARGAIQQYLPSLSTVSRMLFAPEVAPLPSGSRQFSHLRQGIVFRDVSFAYNNRATVLEDFNLEVPCGQTIALVGSSGAGKSTVAVLVPRFYDVTKGTIEIDGADIRDYDLASLRQRIGIVSQDTYIFNTSIRHNIAYGLEDASHDRVVEAARLANADEFIQQLPEGYDTLVGDRGVQLSGGQRQRISIARAILRDPDILILDEATSALDSQSERLVQEALERLRQNRTVIVIAHRLSTIRNADCIVVMQQGRIIERGNHEQLLKNRGSYWSFHNVQSLPVS
jgi:ABC-type multidrug transport system fused ATPase/permease subunit